MKQYKSDKSKIVRDEPREPKSKTRDNCRIPFSDDLYDWMIAWTNHSKETDLARWNKKKNVI
jgi:hypothetical protein